MGIGQEKIEDQNEAIALRKKGTVVVAQSLFGAAIITAVLLLLG